MINQNDSNKYQLPLLFIIICISVFYHFYLSTPLDPIDGHGDSTGRALQIIDNFPFNYTWVTSTIWLPFYFIFYSIPLHMNYSYEALIGFQFIISVLLQFTIFQVVKKHFVNVSPAIVVTISSLMPLTVFLTNTVLSELSFTLFVLGSAYFFTEFMNKKNDLVCFTASNLFLLCASMTRYEGWILYFAYLVFIIIKVKKVKHFLIAFTPFIVCILLLEYNLFKVGMGSFSGIADNHLETSPINFKIGLGTVFSKLKRIFVFHFENVGLLFLAIPLILYKIKEKITIYTFFFIVLWGTLLVSSILDQVAIFDRYWFVSLILLVPISLSALSRIPTKILLILLSITFSIQLYIGINKTKESERLPTNLIYKELQKNRAKNVYIDELDSLYVFYALMVRNRFSKEKIKIVHYDDNITLVTDERLFTEKIKIDFLEKMRKNTFDHLVFIRGSNLYNLIKKENLIDLEEEWKIIYQMGLMIIYAKDPID
jgi:hypothetical protein